MLILLQKIGDMEATPLVAFYQYFLTKEVVIFYRTCLMEKKLKKSGKNCRGDNLQKEFLGKGRHVVMDDSVIDGANIKWCQVGRSKPVLHL